jgi:hypothetical protein
VRYRTSVKYYLTAIFKKLAVPRYITILGAVPFAEKDPSE